MRSTFLILLAAAAPQAMAQGITCVEKTPGNYVCQHGRQTPPARPSAGIGAGVGTGTTGVTPSTPGNPASSPFGTPGGNGTPSVGTNPTGTGPAASASCTARADFFFDYTESNFFFYLEDRQVMAIAFKPTRTYSNGVHKTSGTIGTAILPGNNASREFQVALSECPGDFTRPAGRNGQCIRYGIEGLGGVGFYTGAQAPQPHFCGPLDPTKTYYLNLRYVNPATGQTTCNPAGGPCRSVMAISYQQ